MNNKSIKESISKQIQIYLKKTNITKTSLGEALGVTRTSINRWINCVCAPEIELFPKLCEILEISIFELLGLSLEDHLTKDEIEILHLYASSINFRILIDRYRSEESFKNEIDKIIEL